MLYLDTSCKDSVKYFRYIVPRRLCCGGGEVRAVNKTVIAAGAGLLFGLAVSAVGMVLTLRAMRRGSSKSLALAMALRLLLDLAALGAVYLLRKSMPLPFEPAVIATAVGLSAGAVGLAVLSSRRQKKTGGE